MVKYLNEMGLKKKKKGVKSQQQTHSQVRGEGPGKGRGTGGGGAKYLYFGIINLLVVIYAGLITGGRGVRAWG